MKIIVSDGRGLACQTLTNIKVYDLRGNVVTPCSADRSASLVPLDKGDSEIAKKSSRGFIWAPDESVASGIYLVKVTIGNHTIVRRIALIR